jgi:hypothetical protein
MMLTIAYIEKTLLRVEGIIFKLKLAVQIQIVSSFVDKRISRSALEFIFVEIRYRIYHRMTLTLDGHRRQLVIFEVSITDAVGEDQMWQPNFALEVKTCFFSFC